MNINFKKSDKLHQALLKIFLFFNEGSGQIIAGAIAGHAVFAILIPLHRIILTVFVGVEQASIGSLFLVAIGGFIGGAIVAPEVWSETQVKFKSIEESLYSKSRNHF